MGTLIATVEIAFSNIQNLVGGSNGDSYNFNGGWLSGGIDAGAGDDLLFIDDSLQVPVRQNTFNAGDGDDELNIFGVQASQQSSSETENAGTVGLTDWGQIVYTGTETVQTPLIYEMSNAAALTFSYNETDNIVDLFDADEDSVLPVVTNKSVDSISEVRIIGSSGADILTINNTFGRLIWFEGGEGDDQLVGPDESNFWEITASGEGQLNDAANFTGVEKLVGGKNDDVFRVVDDGSGAVAIDVDGLRALSDSEKEEVSLLTIEDFIVLESFVAELKNASDLPLLSKILREQFDTSTQNLMDAYNDTTFPVPSQALQALLRR